MPNNPTITVIDGANKIGSTQPNFSIGSPTEFSPQTQASKQKSALFKTAVIGLAQKEIQNSLSKVGQRTGNQLKQTQINNGLKIYGMGTTIAMGFAVGGALGVGIGTAKVAYDIYREVEDYNFNVEQTNLLREEQRKFQTYVNSNNRNRGND